MLRLYAFFACQTSETLKKKIEFFPTLQTIGSVMDWPTTTGWSQITALYIGGIALQVFYVATKHTMRLSFRGAQKSYHDYIHDWFCEIFFEEIITSIPGTVCWPLTMPIYLLRTLADKSMVMRDRLKKK